MTHPTIGTVAMGDTEARKQIEEAIAAQWGDRCPDFDAGCACCQTWAEYDRVTAALSTRPAQEPVAALSTGCKCKDGNELFVGDRVRYLIEGPHTKQEYWNPEYEIVFTPPCFSLKRVGGGLDGGDHLFILRTGFVNQSLELLSRGKKSAAPQPVLSQPEVKACPGADDPEERCPRHPSECTCWQVDNDHPSRKAALCPLSDIPAQAGEVVTPQDSLRWLPIAHADKTITEVQDFSEVGIMLRTSDRYWVRDEDGRIYEACWSEGEDHSYWWDFEGESPVDPVEFMPHPLDPKYATASEGSTDAS